MMLRIENLELKLKVGNNVKILRYLHAYLHVQYIDDAHKSFCHKVIGSITEK